MRRYERELEAIHADFRFARLFARVVYSSPGLSFHALFKNALVCRWFTEILLGTMTYRKLFGQCLLRLPLLPLYAELSRTVTVDLELEA